MAHMSSDATRKIGALFDAVAPDYDQSGVPFFQPIADRLVRLLDPQPGERILDIGCGRGAATVPLAAAVRPGGSVTAVDLSPVMVEHTRLALAAAGLSEVVSELRTMDAAAPDLPAAAYDVVASSLVLFFVDDPQESLGRWVELVAPGGRIGLTTFSGQSDPTWAALDELFAPWRPPMMRDPKVAASQQLFSSDESVAAMLRTAGMDHVTTTAFTLPVAFTDVAAWRRWSMGTGQRGMWAAIPQGEVGAVMERADELLTAARGDDGMTTLNQYLRYSIGRRSSEG